MPFGCWGRSYSRLPGANERGIRPTLAVLVKVKIAVLGILRYGAISPIL